MAEKVFVPALRDQFGRYPNHCDHCGAEFAYLNLHTAEWDTAAGSFKYALCGGCCDAMRRMSNVRQHKAKMNAIIRHAARYSVQFARFIADWYGMRRMPRELPEARP